MINLRLVFKPLDLSENDTIDNITNKLNIFRKFNTKKSDQWIWTHNRWK